MVVEPIFSCSVLLNRDLRITFRLCLVAYFIQHIDEFLYTYFSEHSQMFSLYRCLEVELCLSLYELHHFKAFNIHCLVLQRMYQFISLLPVLVNPVGYHLPHL